MQRSETSTEQDRFEQERSELNAVLESPLFSRAPSLRSFLVYICEQHFDGKAVGLKEYRIAVEALGRPENFDHTQDSIVRVEAHKLRKRLKEFYEREGSGHPIHIEIPPGQYAPSFVHQPRIEPETAEPDALVWLGPSAVGAPRNSEIASASRLQAALPGELSLSNPRPRAVLYAAPWLVVVAIVLVVGWRFADRPAAEALTAPPLLAGADCVYRINAGSSVAPYVDDLGLTWLADQFFEGGAAEQGSPTIVDGAWSPVVFQSRREGTAFSYAVPLDPGVYELHLHFAETTYGPGNPGTGESSRIFNVDANGERILASFDVLSDAGRPNAVTTKVFTGLQPDKDGFLHLNFTALTSTAILNGMEIFRGSDKALPIRILAGDRKSQAIDSAGQGWGPDRCFFGGRSVPRTNVIQNSGDPSLYSAERYGHFRYIVPVAAGSYVVRLYFAETWWGSKNPGGGGDGSRVFDVYCNGAVVLRDFDVYREAQGENRAIVKTFRDIKPNPQGRIELSFVPKANYAMINAIEILQQ